MVTRQVTHLVNFNKASNISVNGNKASHTYGEWPQGINTRFFRTMKAEEIYPNGNY